ncbi:MAG TPA: hypothetical protein DD426_00075 [Clostridiaceae bacterium]|nr:hypothetical protein [Clostridiaceae bacterium]
MIEVCAVNNLDKRPNILIIMSDEHDPAVTGCYNHPVVKTPNIDNLAKDGILFENAYCNSPMCVPSRMSFITGRYPCKIDVWDNGSPLRAEIPTFANYFEAGGYDTILCGRMHMIGEERLHGFGKRLFDDMEKWKSYNQKPLRTKEERRGSNSHVTDCGPGRGSWQDYDNTVSDLGLRFLKGMAKYPPSKPWLMVVGFMFPHFPLIAPKEYFNMYYPDNVIMPDLNGETIEMQHPVIQHLRYCFRNDSIVSDEITRKALASYYALITYTDHNIGMLLDVIYNSYLRENTIIIYLSDHGEMAGKHGIWQKQCFYEPSVKVPFIIKIPNGGKSVRVKTNVSLVDVMPTIMELAGIEIPEGLSGNSVIKYAKGYEDYKRAVFSEYHAQGMLNAGFMIKKGDYKYNYYVNYNPELYDVKNDPGEFKDLSGLKKYAGILSDMHDELFKITDPFSTDKRAKENQKLDGIARAYHR